MSNRIYDSSQLTKRRAEKAIAGSFVTRNGPPNNQTSYGPLPGIFDASILNAVKTGQMTEFTRYPVCYGISPGCPCPSLNGALISGSNLPSYVSGITFTIGSIVVLLIFQLKNKLHSGNRGIIFYVPLLNPSHAHLQLLCEVP